MSLLARTSRAEALAARLPPLLVEAERVAETVRQGVHGRRRVGVPGPSAGGPSEPWTYPS